MFSEGILEAAIRVFLAGRIVRRGFFGGRRFLGVLVGALSVFADLSLRALKGETRIVDAEGLIGVAYPTFGTGESGARIGFAGACGTDLALGAGDRGARIGVARAVFADLP